MGLPTGEVTPMWFHCMLNEHILPSLGYTLRKGLLEHTAQQWLVKLGWRNKTLGKGVYMDGYEQLDVVEYCMKIFLPLMALLQKRMVKWKVEGSELMHIDLKLRPGEKRVVAIFQDESSFHINEYKKSI